MFWSFKLSPLERKGPSGCNQECSECGLHTHAACGWRDWLCGERGAVVSCGFWVGKKKRKTGTGSVGAFWWCGWWQPQIVSLWGGERKRGRDGGW